MHSRGIGATLIGRYILRIFSRKHPLLPATRLAFPAYDVCNVYFFFFFNPDVLDSQYSPLGPTVHGLEEKRSGIRTSINHR